MTKTIGCGNCGYEGPVAEYSYVAQAGGRGPETLRRCPACCELVIVDEPGGWDESALIPELWDLSEMRARSSSNKDREVEK
jgi:hypothetical protein